MGNYFIISTKSLPSGSSVTFKDSSFFLRNGKNAIFPSSSKILARSAEQAPSRQRFKERPPVYFEELGLLVKFGTEPKVNVAEGQCLWTLRQVLPQIPVPEVFGWTQDENFTYLFMELVHGIRLDEIWNVLSRLERDQICIQLRSMLEELRCLRQPPVDSFVGRYLSLTKT
ncbi:hypothetical protein VHEMI06452 [[Torrubiella] hemipterigena]|uniref:Protein kinase domain-containing protein n=1 Tax=[Torrubiella] hemipterigena TaxID=1531966 RepID=A0A0A1TL65_9HYPO|nr:hypothetical protein VHEMI06452 [[Torrubiella] hemipterigena]